MSGLASFSLKIFPPGSKMAAAVLYRTSLASSGASKLLFCCGNRKFPGTILLGLAWIPCLLHVCSRCIRCGSGMHGSPLDLGHKPTLGPGTGSAPLKPLRLETKFPPKTVLPKERNMMWRRQKKKKKIHLSIAVNWNYNLLFSQYNYPISEYKSISVNQRRKWRRSHIRSTVFYELERLPIFLSCSLAKQLQGQTSKTEAISTHAFLHPHNTNESLWKDRPCTGHWGYKNKWGHSLKGLYVQVV